MFPLDETNINKIAIEFKLPQSWEAVCPWKKDGDIFIIERDNYQYKFNMSDLLGEAVMGFGNFKMCQREINGFNIKIYTFSEWPDERINNICEQTFRLMKYQLELFGINQKWEYTVIFVPNATDEESRVFGGSWSLGQGFEMEVSTLRRRELVSHRLHHTFNRYYPFGMHMVKKSDGWFAEATASYYEVKALASLGYYKLRDGMSRLKRDYDSLRPEYDVPLSMDYKKVPGP